MDSAYKNQVLASMSKTIGNNKNPTPTHEDRNTIFLLTQYIADEMETIETAVTDMQQKVQEVTTAVNSLQTDVRNIKSNLVVSSGRELADKSVADVMDELAGLTKKLHTILSDTYDTNLGKASIRVRTQTDGNNW
jgi:peptidyl-tRNA hydrolase